MLSATLCAVFVFGCTALYNYLRRPRLSPAEADLQRKLRELRTEAQKLNTPKTFSKWAKNQRQVHLVEKQIATMRETGGNSVLSRHGLPYLLLLALFFVLPFQYPVAGTLSSFFYLPGGFTQAIPMILWQLICFTVLNTAR